MDDNPDPESVLRSICCTCLSVDRRLTQLCRIDDGVNNLFFLLSYDAEAYKTMFQKEATHLFICWECKALMGRLCKFRSQACLAQKQLSDITDGKLDVKTHNTLSKLSNYHQNSYNQVYVLVSNDDVHYNFIDCEPEIDDIKTEFDTNDETLDLPILDSMENCTENINITDARTDEEPQPKIEIKLILKNNKVVKKETGKKERLVKKRNKSLSEEVDSSEEDVNYSTIEMSEQEMIENRENMKNLDSYVNGIHKCESCIESFIDSNELEKHNLELHVQKPRYIQCDICQVYIKYWWLTEHKKEHYTKYKCNFCNHVTSSVLDVLKHLKVEHGTSNIRSKVWQKVKRRAVQTNPALKSRRTKKTEIKTPFGYLCSECNKYFENKYLRYKHILKFHREGFKCKICGKTFAFKNTLKKHEQVHAPAPRQPCAQCGRLVRADRVRLHARTHAPRAPLTCAGCGARFVSRDSYEKHLRYSRAHAVRDVHKYKCTMCEKGFRTLTELNDHINYKHMERTQHKCPICNKALATRRGVTRHVRRAHQGIKENVGDKILCQICGKAFRHKKSLIEHELIHTGEKPLSCDICGRSFRQSACLYTHKRRVHKVALKRKIVHTDDISFVNIKPQ